MEKHKNGLIDHAPALSKGGKTQSDFVDVLLKHTQTYSKDKYGEPIDEMSFFVVGDGKQAKRITADTVSGKHIDIPVIDLYEVFEKGGLTPTQYKSLEQKYDNLQAEYHESVSQCEVVDKLDEEIDDLEIKLREYEKENFAMGGKVAIKMTTNKDEAEHLLVKLQSENPSNSYSIDTYKGSYVVTANYKDGGQTQEFIVDIENDNHYKKVGKAKYGISKDKKGKEYVTLFFDNGSVNTYSMHEVQKKYDDGGFVDKDARNFTLERAFEIQQEQLNYWKTVLIPKAYEDLVEYTKRNNDKVTDPYKVVRGADLDHYIANYKLGNKMKEGGWIQDATSKMKKKGTVGSFTKMAKRHGDTPVEYAKEVLDHPSKHTLKTRRKAQFVKNTNPEKFDEGGLVSGMEIEFRHGRDDMVKRGQILDVLGDGEYAVMSGFSQMLVKENEILGVAPEQNKRWYQYEDGGEITRRAIVSNENDEPFLDELMESDVKELNELVYGKFWRADNHKTYLLTEKQYNSIVANPSIKDKIDFIDVYAEGGEALSDPISTKEIEDNKNREIELLIETNGKSRSLYSAKELKTLSSYDYKDKAPIEIVQKMWGLAIKECQLDWNNPILAFNVGTGDLFKFVDPLDINSIISYESCPTKRMISNILYAKNRIVVGENIGVLSNKQITSNFQLAIGFCSSGETLYSNTLHNSIVRNGYMVAVVSTSIFESSEPKYDKIRQILNTHYDLVVAYKIPSDVMNGKSLIALRKL